MRGRNEGRIRRDTKKTDCGGFFVLQIPVSEKREILIGRLPVSLSSNPFECHGLSRIGLKTHGKLL